MSQISPELHIQLCSKQCYTKHKYMIPIGIFGAMTIDHFTCMCPLNLEMFHFRSDEEIENLSNSHKEKYLQKEEQFCISNPEKATRYFKSLDDFIDIDDGYLSGNTSPDDDY